MTPTLSTAVMAHPSRASMVDELLAGLDRPVEVVWDRVNDRHDTGLRALQAYDPACTHHLVIQDDAVPCVDLLAGAEQALLHVPPGVPVSLYVGRVRPFRRAVDRATLQAGEDASWIVMDGIYWGPAIIVPTELIDELAAWYWSPGGRRVVNYDRRVSTFFTRRRARCWYSWPSLVDHRDSVSLAHPRVGAGRHAHLFAGADRSALDIDWSGPVIDLVGTAKLDRARESAARRAARVPA